MRIWIVELKRIKIHWTQLAWGIILVVNMWLTHSLMISLFILGPPGETIKVPANVQVGDGMPGEPGMMGPRGPPGPPGERGASGK